MKKNLIIFACLLSFYSSKAQLTLDAESGNRSTDEATGWGFGGHSHQASVVITGSYSVQSQQLSNSNINNSWIKTPWVIFQSGNITLDSRLNSANGTSRYIAIRFIPYDANASYQEGAISDTIYWTNHSISTTVQNLSYAVPALVLDGKPWKLMISFGGVGGNSRIVSDNYSIPAKSAFYDTDSDKIPDAMDKYPNDSTNNGKDAIFSRAWNDLDGDGIQDAGEPGVEGASVHLFSGTGSFLNSTTSKYDGNIAFFDIPSGSSRKLRFDKPNNNFSYSRQNQGSNDDIDADNDSTGYTGVFTTSKVVLNQDGGYLAPGTVKATVWNDLDGDGIQDNTETGISGSPVHLFTSAGSYLATSNTDANGIATFTNVRTSQALKLRFDTKTSGHYRTQADQGSDDAIDSDGDQGTGYTANFTLTQGSQVYEQMDGGQWAPGTVNAFVWDDQDGDGIQDSTEPGIAGSPVHLFTSGGSYLSTVNSNLKGIATFTDVRAGQALKLRFDPKTSGHYRTQANVGSNDAINSDGDQSTGYTADFTLKQGSQVYEQMDGGQWAPGTVKAFVWDDQNGDGIQDATEPGISASPVHLFTSGGSYLSTVNTDANGIATFNNVRAGQALKLRFDPKTNKHYRTHANIGSNDIVDSDGDQSTGYTADFTLTQGSQVYEQLDGGQWAPGTINARVWEDTDYDGIQDAGEPSLSGYSVHLFKSNGSYLASTTTNGSGIATFTNVAAGTDLKLRFDKSSTFLYSTQNVGSNDAIDSDPLYTVTGNQSFSDVFSLTMGSQNMESVDAGVISATLDSDSDGIPNYLDKYINDATNNNKAAIISQVWDDRNGNGIQNSNEPGIGSVTVRLRTSSGSFLQTKTSHASSGLVVFFDITSGSNVLLEVTKPTNSAISTKDAGSDDAIDSDIDQTTNRTASFTATGVVSKQDAGIYMPGTINTYVWDDQNGDGLQTSGEPAIKGVQVRLRKSDNSWIASAITDSTGTATFKNVATGRDMIIEYIKPKGHTITSKDKGSNDSKDSDADPTSNKTGVFSLAQGSLTYTAMDCGMWTPGTINTFVWDDQNADGLQTSGEPAIKGVQVRLRKSDNSWIASAKTDSNGIATFTNVATGRDMIIEYVKPKGHTITSQKQGSNDNEDSDADPTTTKTGIFSLTRGNQTYTSMDCGMWAPGTINTYVWNDANKDGIQDAGESGLSGVQVRLRKSDNSWIASANTNGSGIATFTNVATGSNMIIEYVKPKGHTISSQDQGSNDNEDSDADPSTSKTGIFSLNLGSQNLTNVDCGMWSTTGTGSTIASTPGKSEIESSEDNINSGNQSNVVNSKELLNLVLYPVPATNEVNIALTVNKSELLNFNITDATGRIVENGNNQLINGSNVITIVTSQYVEGLYNFTAYLNGEVKTVRFIVTK